MSKILFYLPSLTQYEDRVKTISKVKSSKIIFIFVANDNKKISKEILTEGHIIIYLNEIIKNKKLRLLFQPFIILWISLKYNCEIIHLTSYIVNPLLCFLFCKIFKKKYLVSLYILYSSRFKLFKNINFKEKIFSQQIQRMYIYAIHEYLLLPLVDKLIMQAPGLAAELPLYKKYNKKIYIISNSVTNNKISFNPKKAKSKNENIKLLFIGGIDYTRGVDKIIKTTLKLNQNGYKVQLSLIGKVGSYFDNFLKKVHSDVIKIIPKVERNKLYELIKNYDIFVYPTKNEGSPRIVLELASIGIPIIASKHPGIIAIDKEEKFINYLTNEKTIEYYIKEFLLNKVFFHKRANYGKNYVRSNFNENIISKSYENLYLNLCKI